jgi:hypothetical protein
MSSNLIVKDLWRLFTEKSAEHSRSAGRAGFLKIDCLLNALPRSVTSLHRAGRNASPKLRSSNGIKEMLHREHGAPCSRGSARSPISQPVTATTDFLAPDIVNRCGSAVPALSESLHSTLASFHRRRASIAGGSPSLDGPRQHSRTSARPARSRQRGCEPKPKGVEKRGDGLDVDGGDLYAD